MTTNADYRTADRIVRNTVSLNGQLIQGVPPDFSTYNWAYQGRVGLGKNNPESGLGLTKIIPWGVGFRNKDNPPDNDVMFKPGDIDLWVLPESTGVWTLLQSMKRPNGQLYPSAFTTVAPGDDNTQAIGPAPSYSPAPNKIITQVVTANQCYHFYTARIDYPALLGIIVTWTAKSLSKTGVDISSKDGCYLAQVGCDFKSPDGTTIRDSFVSKTIPITSNLRRFTATSMTLAQLLATPPDWSLFAQFTQSDPIGIDPDYVP